MKSSTFATKTICSIAIAAIFNSCGTSDSGQPATPQLGTYPVVTIDTATVTVYADFAGELRSGIVVEIRPRVSGYIDTICVNEGSPVRKDQLMFRVNQDDLIENRNSAQANVTAAEAQVQNSELEVRKLTPLVEKGIISEFELDNAKSNLVASNAKCDYAKSQLKNAEIDLKYARIVSPVDGVVGRIIVRQGTLVSPSTTEPLTTVSGSGDVSAYFSVDERTINGLLSEISGRSLQEKIAKLPAIELIQSDGTIYRHLGRPEVASGMVDMTTGSVQLKAVFPNQEGMLRTGSSGVVRIPATLHGAVLVPQKATYELQDKRMVYVLDTANTIRSRKIMTTAPAGHFFVVHDGLQRGDKVIYEGIDKMREGMQIIPGSLNSDSLYTTLRTK